MALDETNPGIFKNDSDKGRLEKIYIPNNKNKKK